MKRHMMSHEWESTPWRHECDDTIWVTNEGKNYESRVRRHMSHEWEDISWVMSEKTHESRIKIYQSRTRRHMSHEWDDIWVRNKKTHDEWWVRRHMSHEWEDISWVTNKSPAKVCCSVLQCVAVCCSVLQCVAVYGSVLQRVCCSDMMSHEQVTCSGVMPKSTTSPCSYSVTNGSIHYKTHDMSHEWERTYESQMRRHRMSNELYDTSPYTWRIMSHEWGDISWVTN